MAQDIKFGMSLAPAPLNGETSDYQELWDNLADCEYGYGLGYASLWTQEHHATSYFQMPGTLLFLSHVARSCPEFDLGTAVIVLPWHNPVTLAGELTMLAGMTRGQLRIGCGRGTSRHEYYAMGVNMNQSRARFDEALDILKLAVTGKPFTYEGEFNSYPREITIHPNPQDRKIHLYGACGSVPSAQIMAERGIPPLLVTGFPNKLLGQMIANWKTTVGEAGGDTDVEFNIHGQLIIADTDEEAYEIGRKYYPLFFREMFANYAIEQSANIGVEGYEDFERIFASYAKWANEPGEIDHYLSRQFVGSAETIRNRVQGLVDLGFNAITINSHVFGVPRELRRDSLKRFAEDVAPHFSSTFKPRVGA